MNFQIRALAEKQLLPDYHEITRDSIEEAMLATIKWMAIQGKKYDTITIRKTI
jgi:hypothetical protein